MLVQRDQNSSSSLEETKPELVRSILVSRKTEGGKLGAPWMKIWIDFMDLILFKTCFGISSDLRIGSTHFGSKIHLALWLYGLFCLLFVTLSSFCMVFPTTLGAKKAAMRARLLGEGGLSYEALGELGMV